MFAAQALTSYSYVSACQVSTITLHRKHGGPRVATAAEHVRRCCTSIASLHGTAVGVLLPLVGQGGRACLGTTTLAAAHGQLECDMPSGVSLQQRRIRRTGCYHEVQTTINLAQTCMLDNLTRVTPRSLMAFVCMFWRAKHAVGSQHRWAGGNEVNAGRDIAAQHLRQLLHEASESAGQPGACKVKTLPPVPHCA